MTPVEKFHDSLETTAREVAEANPSLSLFEASAMSIAFSLKRIADTMAKLRGVGDIEDAAHSAGMAFERGRRAVG